MQRYQEIISYHIARNNMEVLNMLNTKYFIVPQPEGEPAVRVNPGALGNAWVVNSFRIVDNANEEIDALNGFNPSAEAIIISVLNRLFPGKPFLWILRQALHWQATIPTGCPMIIRRVQNSLSYSPTFIMKKGGNHSLMARRSLISG